MGNARVYTAVVEFQHTKKQTVTDKQSRTNPATTWRHDVWYRSCRRRLGILIVAYRRRLSFGYPSRLPPAPHRLHILILLLPCA